MVKRLVAAVPQLAAEIVVNHLERGVGLIVDLVAVGLLMVDLRQDQDLVPEKDHNHRGVVEERPGLWKLHRNQ